MKRNEVLLGTEAKSGLKEGIKKLSAAVKSTLGPQGNTVIIKSNRFTAGKTVTKDGVTVAKSVKLQDEVEDMGAQLVKEAAVRTAEQAGDGTTTSIVLTEAILDNADRLIKSENNVSKVIRYIREIKDEVVERINFESIKVKNEDLLKIATISANNDEELGEIISKAYIEAGDDGAVIADKSQNHETYFETSSGMQFKRGLLSSYHVTDSSRNVCELDNPYVLMTSVEIPNLNVLSPILGPLQQSGRPLLIIGNMSREAFATLNSNIHAGRIKAAWVQAPSFGDQSRELMLDMAVALGGRFIDERQGDDWGLLQFSDLGQAGKVLITTSTTSITRPDKKDVNDRVEKLVDELKERIKGEKDQNEVKSLKERITKLTGLVSTIYVGAGSDIEQKEKKDRVDDAILATKAAKEEGYLPGGGLALFRMSALTAGKNDPIDKVTAIEIMSASLAEPMTQIIRNVGLEEEEIEGVKDNVVKQEKEIGYNAATGEYVNMVESGIIDPAKVTRKSIENSVSVATTIMNTQAMVISE